MFELLADALKSGGKMLKGAATVPAMAHDALVAHSEVGLESALAKANHKREYLPLAKVKRESKLEDKKAALKTKLMEAELGRIQEAQAVSILKLQVAHAKAQNKLIDGAGAEFDPKLPLRKSEILSKVLSPEMGAEKLEGVTDSTDAKDDVSPENALADWLS